MQVKITKWSGEKWKNGNLKQKFQNNNNLLTEFEWFLEERQIRFKEKEIICNKKQQQEDLLKFKLNINNKRTA